MFSKSKQSQDSAPGRPEARSAPAPVARSSGTSGSSFSVIGDGIQITGNIDAKVDLHIDGKVKGDIRCASLVQGPTSVIEGAVVAESASLSGRVAGSIEANQLTVASSAQIVGDVVYENIQIEQGGHVDGQFKHKSASKAQASSQPAAPSSAKPANGGAPAAKAPAASAPAGGASTPPADMLELENIAARGRG